MLHTCLHRIHMLNQRMFTCHKHGTNQISKRMCDGKHMRRMLRSMPCACVLPKCGRRWIFALFSLTHACDAMRRARSKCVDKNSAAHTNTHIYVRVSFTCVDSCVCVPAPRNTSLPTTCVYDKKHTHNKCVLSEHTEYTILCTGTRGHANTSFTYTHNNRKTDSSKKQLCLQPYDPPPGYVRKKTICG